MSRENLFLQLTRNLDGVELWCNLRNISFFHFGPDPKATATVFFTDGRREGVVETREKILALVNQAR